ncbi:hypothetical protein NUW54_g12638 [Trametes sanguinea]|uniref:Uncharacterized protein n=1 Tax=Trametes sanguinea TaxID=158606 RepID=A0ACC1MWF5_9APHY|nr:hypothetical protein NUW54_g12638 [Trametes sanguinea]
MFHVDLRLHAPVTSAGRAKAGFDSPTESFLFASIADDGAVTMDCLSVIRVWQTGEGVDRSERNADARGSPRKRHLNVILSSHPFTPRPDAAINNPNVSDEAKEHSRQAIDELEAQPETQETRAGYEEDKDEVRQNAGYKATMKNPNVSQEAKEHAKDILEERGAI